ncbi:MAG TPA: protein kinase, partial [Abditibacteriaceae bacterium]
IHRDVKPANVLLKPEGEGRHSVKLVDFGIARAQEEAGGKRLTKTGMIVGTPEYMSPEQGGSGAKVDHRTDIYALGIIVYEMLCGQPPFKAESDTAMLSVIMQHVRDEPRPPIDYSATLPKSANAAILKALAKDPSQRFNSCGEFITALFSAMPVNIPKTANAPKKSSPLVPMLVGTALFGGVGLVAMGIIQSGKRISSSDAVALPAAATPRAEAGTPKPVTISVAVPHVVGKTETQAREIIKAKSLTADVTTGYSEAFAAQQVMSQYPAVGVYAIKGAPVRIKISMGPKNRTAPTAGAEVPDSSKPSAVGRSDIAEIKSRYRDWLRAWQEMDIDSYMTYYSRDVKQKRPNRPSHGYSTMRSRMTEYWSKLSYIKIQSSEPEVSFEGNRVVLTAVQDYDSNTWWDSGVKRVVWRKESGEWKIVEESFRKRAGGGK